MSCPGPLLRLACLGGGGPVPVPLYLAWGCGGGGYGVALFLRTLYGIPLKWEIHPDDGVNWGEAWVSVQTHRVSILRKGVCRSLAELCDPSLSVE